MLKLKYDCELEKAAKAEVDRCLAYPSGNNPPDVQVNIARISKSIAKYRKNAMLEGVKYWWKQVKEVNGIGVRAIFRTVHLNSTIQFFTRVRQSGINTTKIKQT
ncbi:hypothetical protein GCK32_016004, partial [Trichostrongylus colubriformis]